MRFDYSLYESDQAIKGIHYLHHSTDHEFEITVPVTEPVCALAINLASASDTFIVGEHEYKIADGYFNILSLTKDSTRWRFKEGDNRVLLVTCAPSFLTMLIDNYAWMKGNVPTDQPMKGLPLDTNAHALTPSMEDDIERLLYHADDEGLLRSMYVESKAANLFFSALQTSDDHRQGKVDDATILEIKGVYDFMATHLEEIHDVGQLMPMVTISAERFYKVFDLLYLMSPNDALERERLSVAEGLVRYTNENIFDVSLRAGYLCFDAFLVAFENRFGMHPSEFRDEYGLSTEERFDF
jgi:AraC-like DNA-binding protein